MWSIMFLLLRHYKAIVEISFADNSIRTCSDSDLCCRNLYRERAAEWLVRLQHGERLPVESFMAEPLRAKDHSWFSCRGTDQPVAGEALASGPWRMECPQFTLLKSDWGLSLLDSSETVQKAVCHEVQLPEASGLVSGSQQLCIEGTWQWNASFTGVQACAFSVDEINRVKVRELTVLDENESIVVQEQEVSCVSFISTPQQQGHHFHACVDKTSIEIVLRLSWYRP